MALQLSGLTATGRIAGLGIPRAAGCRSGEVLAAGSPPVGPLPLAHVVKPGWDGRRLAGVGSAMELELRATKVRIDRRCGRARQSAPMGSGGVTGIAIGDPTRLIVPCGAMVTAPQALDRAGARRWRPHCAPHRRRRTRTAPTAVAMSPPASSGWLLSPSPASRRCDSGARPAGRAGGSGRPSTVEPTISPGPRLALVRLPHERGP